MCLSVLQVCGIFPSDLTLAVGYTLPARKRKSHLGNCLEVGRAEIIRSHADDFCLLEMLLISMNTGLKPSLKP